MTKGKEGKTFVNCDNVIDGSTERINVSSNYTLMSTKKRNMGSISLEPQHTEAQKMLLLKKL
jgi:hypothetical protein